MSNKFAEIEASLPPVPQAAGNYVHAVRTGNHLYLAGKGPISDVKGKVGAEFTKEEGYQYAREVGLTLLAVLKAELGKGAKLTLLVMNAGGKLVRQEIRVAAKGAGGDFTLRGINLLAGETPAKRGD